MSIIFNEARSICLLISPLKDIVIFPVSKSNKPFVSANGKIVEGGYFAAYFPIEVKYPYTRDLLAEKIEEGIEAWDKYPCFRDEYGDEKTYEAKYCGERSFKKAVKGYRHISLGWDKFVGKYVRFHIPLKSGYAYIGLDSIELPDDADWSAFAEAVIHYVELDITTLKRYKTYKMKLNL